MLRLFLVVIRSSTGNASSFIQVAGKGDEAHRSESAQLERSVDAAAWPGVSRLTRRVFVGALLSNEQVVIPRESELAPGTVSRRSASLSSACCTGSVPRNCLSRRSDEGGWNVLEQLGISRKLLSRWSARCCAVRQHQCTS